MLQITLFAVVSYLIGSFPTGLVLAEIVTGQDLRRSGSGNIGATNVARLLGKKLGLLTLLGDMLKGFGPVWAGAHFFQSPSGIPVCICGLAAFCGHLFPLYLRFRGGKGVATAFGLFLFFAPQIMLMVLVLFVCIVGVSRYISLGSLTAATAMPFLLAGFCFPPAVIAMSVIIALLVFYKHRPNIKRLLQGTENKIGA